MISVKGLRPVVMAAVGVSLSFASAPAMANPCVAGMQGCVLPLLDPPVAATGAELPPAAGPGAEAVESSGFGWLIPALAAAAAAVLAFVLLNDDDGDRASP